MQALDLTKQPPRSPKEELDGLVMLPRTIDKLRASLPGGNMGAYQIPGFSESMLEAIGVSEDELRDAVEQASSDEDVVVWLRGHADKSKYREFSERMRNRTLNDLENPARFRERYPIVNERPDLHYLMDVLEADDRQMFAK